MKGHLDQFDEIWCVDFEFSAPSGERPRPICLVALEVREGRMLRVWEEDLRALRVPPFGIGPRSLVVAYYASAEMGCHLALGWAMPENVLDLFAEFRCMTNGTALPCGAGLLGALAYFGLDAIEAADKEAMRDLAIRGGPWTNEERRQLLDYCESDVRSLESLLRVCVQHVDYGSALLRGRYMKAAAQMEWVGVPIDHYYHKRIGEKWDDIKAALISEVDEGYGVYDGRTFKQDRWSAYLADQGIPWPRLESGRLALDDETFRQMARAYPKVAPIRELRSSLSEMRLSRLAVGEDSRNRCLLSAFRSKTGRNQPSNAKFIFGPSVWLRGLIKPPPGHGLAYVDWSQQEFGIAAALSGDVAMCDAYDSGDPYLAFAKEAGVVPQDATKASHGSVREQFKQCVLGVQYSMGEATLARRIGQSLISARHLLDLHRRTFSRFWKWSDGVIDFAMIHRRLHTVCGWQIHVTGLVHPRTLRNFPMQANGAEMLRLACCIATESGISVCAPVHDALLIEAPLADLDDAVCGTQRAMADASRLVLDGFELATDAEVICYPERYDDPRGARMWNTVTRLVEGVDSNGAVA